MERKAVNPVYQPVRLLVTSMLSIALCSCVSTSSSTQPTTPGEGPTKPVPAFAERTGQPGSSPTSVVVAPSPRVDKIELEMAPFALNLDSAPGPDGVQVKVRFYNLEQPRAFTLQQGAIEFILFEGRVKDEEIAEIEPFYTWYFSAADLQSMGRNTLVGIQHAIVLNWAGHTPRATSLTLAARIPRPNASPLYARPVFLSTSPK